MIDGYLDKIFAVDGDVTIVPDDLQPDGTVSFDQGYPIGYEIAPGDPGSLPVERDKTNYLYNIITTILQYFQQGKTPVFITSVMNGGTAYTYSKYERAFLGGIAYQSLVNSNTDTPPSSKWGVVDIYSGLITVNGLVKGNGSGDFTAGTAGSDYASPSTNQTFTKSQRGAIVLLTDGATITADFSQANNFQVALAGNRTLANPSNLVPGQSGCIAVYQDATGSRTLSYSWGWTFNNNGTAPVLSTAGTTQDRLYYDVQVANTATVTISIASPGVVTWTGHKLVTGNKLQFTSTGSLPTGLSINTTYYAIIIDANSFWVATSQANAATGTKINTSGSQSGTQTGIAVSICANLIKAWT